MKTLISLFNNTLFVFTLLIIFAGCETEDLPKTFPPPTPCPGAETVEYGGEIYPTVKMGNQCWMAKNLNIGVQLNSRNEPANNDTIEKYCLYNDSINCIKYGAFYQWDELMKYSSEPGSKDICPEGWHIPSESEYADLIYYVEGYSGYLMKNDSSWGSILNEIENECPACIGATGFELLPSGKLYRLTTREFREVGEAANYWTSDLSYAFMSSSDIFFKSEIAEEYNCFSVRCIKDE